MNIKTLTVTEVSNYIKRVIDNDFILGNLSVKGEISNLKFHSSGHIYFSLKDESSKINCVMFKSKAMYLDVALEEGMQIVVTGRASIYPATGKMCIRDRIIGASDKIMKYITSGNRVYNTIIISPPKCGKTTILRDIARNISEGINNPGIVKEKLDGKKVVIVDERSEIAACFMGIPQNDLGVRTDVLDNCLKREGLLMAIRSLSPDVLICDEIGTTGDVEALAMAFNSGVNIITTIHRCV